MTPPTKPPVDQAKQSTALLFVTSPHYFHKKPPNSHLF